MKKNPDAFKTKIRNAADLRGFLDRAVDAAIDKTQAGLARAGATPLEVEMFMRDYAAELARWRVETEGEVRGLSGTGPITTTEI